MLSLIGAAARRRAWLAAVLLACTACGAPGDGPAAGAGAESGDGPVSRDAGPMVPEATVADRLDLALDAGDVDAALELVPELIADARRTRDGDPHDRADTLEQVGERLFDAGIETADGLAAVQDLTMASLELRRAAPQPRPEAVAATLADLATLALHVGDPAAAQSYQEEALAIHRRRGDDAEVADSLRGLGTIQYVQNRFEAARECLTEAVRLLETEEPPPAAAVAETKGDLAEVLRALDRYDEAETLMRDALAQLDRHAAAGDLPADDPARAVILENLAGLLRDEGRVDEAVATLERARRLGAETTDLHDGDRATTALNLAELYHLQRRTAEARRLYTEAVGTAESFYGRRAPEVALFANQLAVFYADLDRAGDAVPLFRDVISILEEAGESRTDPTAGRAHHDLGRLLRRQGRDAEAATVLGRALELREAVLGPAHTEVAATLVELAAVDAPGEALDDDADLALLDRALETLGSGHVQPAVTAEAMSRKAEILWRRGRRRAAVAQLARALEIVESRRHRRGSEAAALHFFDTWIDLYERLVSWQLELGDRAAAFATTERRRARIHLDRLSTAGVDLRGSIPPSVLEPLERRERNALARLTNRQESLRSLADSPSGGGDPAESLGRQIDDAARELQQVEGEIRAASPIWRRLVVEQGAPITLDELQRRHVTAGTLVLAYQVGREESLVMAIPPAPGEIRVQSLRMPAPVAELFGVEAGPLTAASVASVVRGDRGDGGLLGLLRASRLDIVPLDALVERLAALHRVLVPPSLWREVQRAESILVIPDGALHLLPFSVLVVDDATGSDDPAYWLDRGPPVSYAPSASVFANLSADEATPRGTPRLLVVADPVFRPAGATAAEPGTVLRPLPGTRREGKVVRDLAPGLGLVPTRLQGAEASETAVRRELLTSPRYLHLATHGLVDTERVETLAGLALSSPASGPASPEDDGLLQLFELNRIGLDCELAVLSACNTQFGPTIGGEGSLTLARGFLSGGARRVVASLWPVDDQATVELMRHFYSDLAAQAEGGGPVRHRVALWRAMAEVKTDSGPRSSPYVWGPFVLIGAR